MKIEKITKQFCGLAKEGKLNLKDAEKSPLEQVVEIESKEFMQGNFRYTYSGKIFYKE